MSNVWISLIITMLKRLLDPEVVSRILSIVSSLDSTELSGTEKRTLAFDEAVQLAKEAAPWLLNLAIEIAVARLRTTA